MKTDRLTRALAFLWFTDKEFEVAKVARTKNKHSGPLSVALAVSVLGVPASAFAQSPNAFGQPTHDVPTPAANIAAVPGTRAQGWQGQGRSEVLARHGMVATSDPLAAQAGLEVMQQGGNAMDAAVAAAAVLDVTSQNDTCLLYTSDAADE